jgi:Protein of unknown function (DUF2567)
MQSAEGAPGPKRNAEVVSTKADSALTPTHELSPTELPGAESHAADTPRDGRPIIGTSIMGGSMAGAPAGLAGSAAVLGAPVEVMWLPPARRAPVVSRGDLFGALSLASLVSLIGLPLGWLWSRLAPTQQSVVQEDLSLVALPIESQHRFDDLATFVMLGAVAGLLVGAAAWLARGRRGPLTVVGLAAGSLFAAWLAVRVGVSFALARNAQLPSPLTPGDLVAVAPRLESNWVIVVQPLFAVVAYGIAAAANGLEDLGRRLS